MGYRLVHVLGVLELRIFIDALLDKYLSREAKNRASSCSCFWILSSSRKSSSVRSVEWRSTSLTVRKCGLSSLITQQFGEILISQSVKAYKASMVLSEETPGARCTKISTSLAVLSSTFLILIFPLSFAFRMDSITVEVVFHTGSPRSPMSYYRACRFCTDFHRSTPFSIIIFGYVDRASCLEIRV